MSVPDDFREPHLRQGDFLGAFGVLQRDDRILVVGNERRIRGETTRTWDLPGGQVEPGERIVEALQRELREELAVDLASEPQFLFVQEGQRVVAGRRVHAWRSFFFAVPGWRGEPVASGEVLGLRWCTREQLLDELRAPYHDSFCSWLRSGGYWFQSAWQD